MSMKVVLIQLSEVGVIKTRNRVCRCNDASLAVKTSDKRCTLNEIHAKQGIDTMDAIVLLPEGRCYMIHGLSIWDMGLAPMRCVMHIIIDNCNTSIMSQEPSSGSVHKQNDFRYNKKGDFELGEK